MMDWLNGKKTYIISAVSAISAWVGVWAGTVDIATALIATQVALTGSAIRHGIANS